MNNLKNDIEELHLLEREWNDINEELAKAYPLQIKQREIGNLVDQKIRDILEKIKSSAYYAEFVNFCENNYEMNSYHLELTNNDEDREVMIDDGTLHISFGKIRACFISNQEINRAEWNKLAKWVLKELVVVVPEFKNIKL